MGIKRIVFGLRSLGINGIYHALRYSIQRDRINKRDLRRIEISEAYNPGNLAEVKPVTNGVLATFEHARLEVVFIAEDLVRISWEPGLEPIPYTIAVSDWPPLIINTKSTEKSCSISTSKMGVSIRTDGAVSFLDSQQNLLRTDNPPFRSGEHWSITTKLKLEEHIYGLGERAAPLNLRPGQYCSWNTDPGGNYSLGSDPLYIGTPVYLSLSTTGNYLVYCENSYKSQFRLDDDLNASFEGGMLRYYFIFGTLNSIYERFTQLVGRPFLPPRWVLGYHQCRWGYRSEDDIRQVANDFAAKDLPISAIHLDIDYMDGYRVFTVNSDRFPNLQRLADDMESAGIHLVATINPAVKKDANNKVFTDGIRKDVFCKLADGKVFTGVSWPGWSVYPDFTKPEARNWWSEQYRLLLEVGISGFWHDMNEPVSMSAWGDPTFPKAISHSMEGRTGDHSEAHNLYGLLMNRAGFDGIRHYAPHKRPWIFSRSGWTGLQRYAWNWTGDVETSWEALRHTITTLLGLGLSGHAFSGVDIGGFSGTPEAELYLRWFQMATFLPLFRTHSSLGSKPREPWVFGEPTTSIIRNFLKLRYRLLPYFYTVIWETCKSGVPPIRPLFWECPEDANLWDISDEFMVGNSILIAPILSKDELSRQVVLPDGIWYSFWDEHSYSGPMKLEVKATRNTIPVFIKGGSVLPMEENKQLSLHIYPGYNENSSNEVYTDAGDGYEAWRLDTFVASSRDNKMVIAWKTEGEFPFPYTEVTIVVHGRKLMHAEADDVNLVINGDAIRCPVFQTLSLTFEG